MSDTSIIPGGFPVPSDVRVATDQVTILGSGTSFDPIRLAGADRPFALSVETVYANATGSDTAGDGKTPATAYRTFQRAAEAVPLVLAAGQRFILDITDLGVEILPFGYTLPAIQTPTLAYDNDYTIPYFFYAAALTIRAIPQLVAALPPADAVIDALAGAMISADPDTGLITLTLSAPRASWDADALKGKMVIRTIGSYLASSAIRGSTTTTLTICNNAANFNGGVGALVLASGEVLELVEPSAELQGPGGPGPVIDITGIDAWGSLSAQISSIGFQGIKFTQPGSFFPLALTLSDGVNTALELCDIQGFQTQGPNGMYFLSISGSVVRDVVLPVQSAAFFQACFITDVVYFYMVAVMHSFINTIVADSASIQGGFQFGAPIALNALFNGVLIEGSVAGFSSSPNGDAIYLTQGRVDLTNVQINGAQGSALNLEQGVAYAKLTNVTGTGNGGQGVIAADGAIVQITDDATLVTGDLGDIQCGTLAPRNWTDFRGTAPIKNEYDLTTPFVAASSGAVQPPGDELTGAGSGGRSGSRIFQKA